MKNGLKKFYLLWLGELVSSIGGGLTSFGLGVYVFQTTGSVTGTAMISLLAFLPTLLLSVPAGILADRFDRRLLMMIGDGCSAIGLIYILVCMLGGDVRIWQIYIGVLISSVFSSLLEPAYRATISELLTKEEYARASGMVSMAGSARYLISPVLAGILLTVSDVSLLLMIDIGTFGLTLLAVAVVRNSIKTRMEKKDQSFFRDLQEGWLAVTEKRGVFILVIMSSFVCLSMGTIQVLSEPMILAFSDSMSLGTAESICACGMLVSGVVLGIRGIKKGYVKLLALSLGMAGVSMFFFGLRENMLLICISGFLFFCMLPVSSCCIDYLVRTNISEELQGRAWGLIGFLSQIGYVVAYGAVGIGADAIADSFSISAGRGCGVMILLAGGVLVVLAGCIYRLKSIRRLEASPALEGIQEGALR